MKRPAVFFDRDNTLIVSDGYLGDPSRVVLVEGAADAVAKARQYGFKVLTISNQSGVARGYFDESAVQAVNARMDEMLQAANPAAKIIAHEYCPSHPEAEIERYREDSPRRKPRPGMLLDAAEEHNLDLSRSWLIGDAPRDIEAGHAAGCRTILFRDPSLAASPAADTPSNVTPDFVVSSLKEAVNVIAKEAFKAATPQTASPAKPPSDPPPPQIDPAPSTSEEPAPAIDEDPPAATIASPQQSAAVEWRQIAPAEESIPEPPPSSRRRATRQPGDDGDARAGSKQVQQLLMQILLELKRQRNEGREFSMMKLAAIVAMVLSVALLVLGYLARDPASAQLKVLFAIAFQAIAIALLIIGKKP